MLTAGPPSENRTPCITVETVPDSVRPEPVEGPARPHSRHSCEASNPEGPPPIRHSCEGRNPEGRRLSGEYSRPNRQAKTGRHASPKAQFTIPFALSLSKGLPAPMRHSSVASNPEGRRRPFALREIEGGERAPGGARQPQPPSHSRLPQRTVGAFRETPVPRERDPANHRGGLPAPMRHSSVASNPQGRARASVHPEGHRRERTGGERGTHQ